MAECGHGSAVRCGRWSTNHDGTLGQRLGAVERSGKAGQVYSIATLSSIMYIEDEERLEFSYMSITTNNNLAIWVSTSTRHRIQVLSTLCPTSLA